MSNKIRVILVEDSTTFRELVKNVLEENREIEVVSQALNGKVALPRIRHYEPDLLVLDQEMPEMSGLELLREIKGKYPTMGTIMLSAHTIQGARLTIKCLEEGAWDFITKPSFGSDGDPAAYIREKLVPRILEFHKRKHFFKEKKIPVPASEKEVTKNIQTVTKDSIYRVRVPRHLPGGFCKAVGIGISTGGPVALRELFSHMKQKLKSPMFIVQHMPPVFTKQLAESLNDLTENTVVEAQDGMIPLPGYVYIAPGGKHMVLENKDSSGKRISIVDDPPEENCKPSVNKLFRSLAKSYESQVVSVIMTGMGTDGYNGILSLKEKNSYLIGQNKESCLIFGMPERPIRENIVDEVLNIQEIAERINYLAGVER